MRDINRIDPFLKEVGELWKKVPDWRFTQLFMNIPFERDPFFMEEDEFLKALKEMLTPYGKLGEIDD